MSSTEPATVLGLTILAVVQCAQCKGDGIALMNALSGTCPVCGGLVALEAVDWRHDRPAPRVGLSFTPRSRLIQT